ncbi:MAG TPA: L-seryl-tRNA(Sec) selenium transferase [Polyangia bacterium]|nr:L-seryl-tRNA(Sec) selenium transferase [Polyangia bacterium]
MNPPADGGADRVNATLRRLPKVDDVLERPAVRGLLERAPRWAVVSAVRGEIERLRARLLERAPSESAEPQSPVELDERAVGARVEALLRPSLVRVLNATGVVLHTNLGRAPLAEAAVARVAEIARGYSNLEYKLDERRRGSRHDHVSGLLRELTGAEDALVVNNCAGAVLLALAATAQGRSAIVSRGELVEIGGSFRVPDVMRASGVKLVEVGTTNRTHAKDYEAAIGDDTALLLKVHRSNFAVVGFTAEVSAGELAAIGRARKLGTMVDLGSGALADLRALGLPDGGEPEPTARELVATGTDLVTFSGDKLLGGPQAGVLVGRAHAIAPCRSHPLLRALRPSKLTLAALEATLELYRDGRLGEIPTLAMLTTPEPTLEARARKLRDACAQARPELAFDAARVRSAVGGGALPLCEPWSWAVAVTSNGGVSADALDAGLRAADPPVVGRISDGRLLLDARTLGDEEIMLVARAFATSKKFEGDLA